MTLALVALSVALSAALAVHTSSRCPWRPRHRDARWLACAGCWFDAPWYAWRWARRGFRPYDEEEE